MLYEVITLKDQDTELQALIAESLVKLAQEHCGAILVFPGKEPIKDKISGGYQLNAVPSLPLIFSYNFV